MEIIVDTNALIYAAKQKLDVYELMKMHGYDVVVPDCVVRELKSLCGDATQERSTKKGARKEDKAAHKGADKAAAKLAAQIVEEGLKVVKAGKGRTDDVIVAYAKKRKAKVLTNDRELKQRLKEAGIASLSVSKSKQVR